MRCLNSEHILHCKSEILQKKYISPTFHILITSFIFFRFIFQILALNIHWQQILHVSSIKFADPLSTGLGDHDYFGGKCSIVWKQSNMAWSHQGAYFFYCKSEKIHQAIYPPHTN